MACITKKSVKWNVEPASMISTADYSKLQSPVMVAKSEPRVKNMVSCGSTVTNNCAPPHNKYSLPSLAPLTGQDVEVGVLTTLPSQQAHIDAMYGQREQDRKVRREIANSNERRRMQSINAGFKSLKAILPQTAGEKLSKASILQQTAEYILRLDDEKTKLLNLNEKFRSALSECKCDNPKRKALLNVGSDKDEGIGSPREEELEDVRRDRMELRLKLEKERIQLEEKVCKLESNPMLDEETHKATEPRSHVAIKPKSEMYSTLIPPITKTETTPLPHTGQSFCQQNNMPKTISPPVNTNLLPASTCTNQELATKPGVLQNKINLPRSRQPLKKRAVEIIDTEFPRSKVSKVQISSSSTPAVGPSKPVVMSPNTAQNTSFLVPQGGPAPVFAVSNAQFSSVPVALQPGDVKQEKVFPQAGMINSCLPINLTEHPVLLPATASSAPTYITLSPASVTWPESQVALTTTSYSFAINSANPTHPAPPHYVIQSALPRPSGHPEEITLNQLNAVPPLSMTLTQLNTAPSVARLSTIPQSNPTPPAGGLQPHFLPVVAMDTVLGHQHERRMSNATTDSAPSDEETKSADDQATQKSQNAASISRRTKSDPGATLPEPKEVILCNPNSSILNHGTLSVLSNGPGSPLLRQIDAATTRRNLETIVQAIDHLEQQERRNSQDQQINV